MNYLTSEYWNYFIKKIKTKDGEEKLIRDGYKFEELIEELLNLLYQDVHWEKTKRTHDGNKDFLGEKDDGSYIWAECKNYSERISLKVIAPTFVMAEIKDIQEILVFSYSAINKNTKKKLLYYANKREKRIYYYDDVNLEKLLFRFRTKIFPQFFKNFHGNPKLMPFIEPYVFSCSMPGIYYNNKVDFKSYTFNIKLNELVFVGIGIINNNYSEKLQIKLSFNDYNDLEYMEVVDVAINNSCRYTWNRQIILDPGEAQFYKLYFRPVRFSKELLLPSIKIAFLNSEIPSKIIRFKKITCNDLFNVPLIGSSYIQALQKLNDITINKSKMSLVFLYGKSGVGKSRLLQESLSIYIRNHYHVLNFTIDPLAKDSLYMIREIIYFIYNLTPELVTESLKEYQEETSFWGNDQLEIISLLQNAVDDNMNIFLEMLSKYKCLIYEKILSQRNVFIIDNIQFSEYFFVKFLYDLCIYAKSYQRNTSFVLVVSCNVDYYCSPTVKSLRLLAEELKNQSYLNILIHEVKGMKKNDLALGFLKQLIQTEDENDNVYLNIIVQKANYVPKYIENIVEYLSEKQLLSIEHNYFIIRNLKDFYSTVDCIPDSFSEIFQMRYQLFLSNEKLSEDSVSLIIAAIHFLGYLTKEQAYKLHLNLHILQSLQKYGFIEKNNMNELQFNHDLYEQFFMDNYTLEEIFLTYIVSKELLSSYNYSSWQKVLILSKQRDKVQQMVKIMNSWGYLSWQIPYKLKKYFYNQVISYLSNHFQGRVDLDEYMECSQRICLDAKNNLGISFSQNLFKIIYNSIEGINIDVKEKSKGYQKFIYEYSENLLQGNDNKVIQIYKQRIGYLSQDYEKNYRILARLYNRIYVFYKNRKEEKKVHKYLEKSRRICKQKQLLGLEIENLYDEGNYYLFEPKKKECIIECWSQGYSLFEKNHNILEHLTLNSLKKKIQVDLLCNKYDDIDNYFEQAFDYIEIGRFNQQTLFFNASMYYLKAVYGLLSGVIDTEEIRKLIDMAGKYYVLMNNEKPYSIHFLYAKLAYREGRYQEMTDYYNNALQNITKKHYYHDTIKKIILDDCCLKIGTLRNGCINYNINYNGFSEELVQVIRHIENVPIKELKKYLNSFRSISNFTDQSQQEAFIF